MTGKHGRDVPKRLNLLHEGAGAYVTEAARKTPKGQIWRLGTFPLTGNPRSPHKRRIPRKPSPAQIERFEAMRARVMGIPGSR